MRSTSRAIKPAPRRSRASKTHLCLSRFPLPVWDITVREGVPRAIKRQCRRGCREVSTREGLGPIKLFTCFPAEQNNNNNNNNVLDALAHCLFLCSFRFQQVLSWSHRDWSQKGFGLFSVLAFLVNRMILSCFGGKTNVKASLENPSSRCCCCCCLQSSSFISFTAVHIEGGKARKRCSFSFSSVSSPSFSPFDVRLLMCCTLVWCVACEGFWWCAHCR